MFRPDGLAGPLVLTGTGRDLYTDTDLSARTVAKAQLEVTIDYMAGRIVTAINCTPDRPALRALVGTRAGSGFRAALSEALDSEQDQQSITHALLDDVPVVTLISGHAISAQTPVDAQYWARRGQGRDLTTTLRNANICEGWREGGTIMTRLRAEQAVPRAVGPVAPDITGADPLGWHTPSPIRPAEMRRMRRIDVFLGEAIEVDAMFRDSYRHTDGVESVIHEYTVQAAVDRRSGAVRDIAAEPRVLPWFECPTAAASAKRLAGQGLETLRTWVRSDLIGVGTCTHLNDALRSLSDVKGLAERLARLTTDAPPMA